MSRLYEALQRAQGAADERDPRADGPDAREEAPAPDSLRWMTGSEPSEDSAKSAPPPAGRARRSIASRLGLILPAAVAGVYLVAYAASRLGEGGPQRLTGVVASNEVVIAAKTAGRIEHLGVQEGSWVKAGDLIARLDREELDAERQHQLALIGQLSAKLRQGHEVVSLEGDRGRGRVASAEAQLQVARSQHGEAVASLEQLRKDDERADQLFKEGLLSRQEAERIHTEVRVCEARLRSLADQVARAEADLDLARTGERQTEVARRDVDQTSAQIDQARAELAQISARTGYTEVRAPLGGMVSVRVAREGEVVRLGDPIVTIVDLDDVWVRADVEEGSVNRVVVSQALDVELASGERLRGRVTLVEPEAQFATQRDVSRVKRDIRTFGIKVALPNADRRLHAGMTAYVLLPGSASPGTGK
jgi:HlyD family secretion protein